MSIPESVGGNAGGYFRVTPIPNRYVPAGTSNEADKIYVSGSTREEHTLETTKNGTTATDPFSLLEGTIKRSTRTGTSTLHQRTRSAHGFKRVALNLGDGAYDRSTNTDTVRLMAQLEVYRDDGNDHAKAVIGPRTLICVPAKLANDATIYSSDLSVLVPLVFSLDFLLGTVQATSRRSLYVANLPSHRTTVSIVTIWAYRYLEMGFRQQSNITPTT